MWSEEGRLSLPRYEGLVRIHRHSLLYILFILFTLYLLSLLVTSQAFSLFSFVTF